MQGCAFLAISADHKVIRDYVSSNLTDCFGSMHIPDQSELLNPQACGSLSFVDADRTGYNTNRRIYASGVSTGPLTIENMIKLLKLSASQGMTLVPGSGYNAAISAASVVFDNQYGVHGRSNKTTAPWAASTAYTVGTIRMNDGEHLYICTTAGTSASSGGPTGTGTGISDGSCVWNYLGSIDESMIGISSSNYTSIASPSEGGGLILQARNPNGGIQLIAGGGGQWYVDSSANLIAPATFIEMNEMTAPSNPSSAKARLFVRHNAGKTELCIIFPTGALRTIIAEL